MSHPSYFLGIDLGSSSVKTSLFDSDKGDTIDSITYPEKEMKIVSKKKGWAEQDPNYWWQCIEKCLITFFTLLFFSKRLSKFYIAFL